MSGEAAARQAVNDLLTANLGYRANNYDYPYLSYQEHKDQYIDAYWDSFDGDGGWLYKWITHPSSERQIDENEAYYNDYIRAQNIDDRLAWERQVGTPVLVALAGQYLWNAAAPALSACSVNPIYCANQASIWAIETIGFEGAPAAGLGMTAAGLAKTLSKEQLKELTVLMVGKEKGLITVTPEMVNKVLIGESKSTNIFYDKAGDIITTESKVMGQAGKGNGVAPSFKELSVDEIARINKSYGGSTTLTGEIDTILANMSYRDGFYDKAAVAIRDIAGRHMFDDGNKRTAQMVVEQLANKNGVILTGSQIRKVVDDVATGKLRDIDDISRALKNGK